MTLVIEENREYVLKKLENPEKLVEKHKNLNNSLTNYAPRMHYHAKKGTIFIYSTTRYKRILVKPPRYLIYFKDENDRDSRYDYDSWVVIPEWVELAATPGNKKFICNCNLIISGCTCGVFTNEQTTKGLSKNKYTGFWEKT